MKQFIMMILRKIAFWSLTALYNRIDTNDDGKLSKKELVEFAEELENWATSLKNSV